jgi:hypothetical protein
MDGPFIGVLAFFLGIVLVIGAFSAIALHHIKEGIKQRRKEKAHQQRIEQEWREEEAHRQRIESFGAKNAAPVESALAAVRSVVASEAAREGWLGDVDFTADLGGITENFRKVHALRTEVEKLTVLDNPSTDDRRVLADANVAIAKLEQAAFLRVELIKKCATEAQLIDNSLHDERQDHKTAGQREESNAKLSAMLYGIKATPDAMPTEAATDVVMVRVQAYREIKNQIQCGRDDQF